MGIVDGLWSVAKDLWGLRGQLAQAKREQRDRMSDYFKSVSECLAATHESLRRGEYPHQRCAELEGYANLMEDTLKGAVDLNTAANLAARLREVHEVERLYGELQSSPTAPAELHRLAEAAGSLAALSNSVRAGLAT